MGSVHRGSTSARRAAGLCALAALVAAGTARAQGSICPGDVVGFYPSWARHLPYLPSDIGWSDVTIVTHAFLEVLPDATLREDADFAATRPPLVAAAHGAGRMVMAAVGGWGGCTGARLQTIAGNPTLRATLAANLEGYCRTYGYDGITIDWEFPGAAYSAEPACVVLGKNAASCTTDRVNLVLLSQEIRARFAAASPRLRLHIDLPMTGWYGECFDGAALAHLYDRLEVMAYDMHGDWTGHAGHNAQITEPSGDSHGGFLSSAAAIDYWTVSRGVPADRLLLGVPFYGWEYPQACALGDASVTGAVSRPYRAIAQAYIGQGWSRSHDAAAGVPFLHRDSGCGLVAYDDAASLGSKAELARARGIAGLMIWDLSQDVPDGALLRAASSTLCCTHQPGTDCDGDGVAGAADCAPFDAGAFSAPGTIGGLAVSRGAGATVVVSWEDLSEGAGTGTVYDVVSGPLADLATGVAAGSYLAYGIASPSLDDARPVVGGVFFLVRGRNVCGSGGWGRASDRDGRVAPPRP